MRPVDQGLIVKVYVRNESLETCRWGRSPMHQSLSHRLLVPMRRNPKPCLLTRQLYSFTDILVHMHLTNHGSFLPEAVLPGNTASIHFGQTARQAELERQPKAILFFSHKEEHALFIFTHSLPFLAHLNSPNLIRNHQ